MTTAACALLAACGLDVLGAPTDAGLADVTPDVPDARVEPATEAGQADARPPPDANVLDAAIPDAAIPDAAIPCPESPSVRFGGHCYFLVPAGTQASVKQACMQQNAHLVTIAGADEQAAVAPLGTADRWIGLYAQNPNNNPSDYVWLDGAQTPYRRWKPGNPDENGGCVVMDRGDGDQWVDRACTLTTPTGLCERD